jgi:hypothetical protein
MASKSESQSQVKAKVRRDIKEDSSPSPSIRECSTSDEDRTFGLQAPVVDFLNDGTYITKFGTLKGILEPIGVPDDKGEPQTATGLDRLMKAAYEEECSSYKHCPLYSDGYRVRWIHVPANNMEWVEVYIFSAC